MTEILVYSLMCTQSQLSYGTGLGNQQLMITWIKQSVNTHGALFNPEEKQNHDIFQKLDGTEYITLNKLSRLRQMSCFLLYGVDRFYFKNNMKIEDILSWKKGTHGDQGQECVSVVGIVKVHTYIHTVKSQDKTIVGMINYADKEKCENCFGEYTQKLIVEYFCCLQIALLPLFALLSPV